MPPVGHFTMKLQGGLGNQLFQVAAAESEELRRGATARYFADCGPPLAVERFLGTELPHASTADVLVTGGRLRRRGSPAGVVSAGMQFAPWVRRLSSTFEARPQSARPTTMEGYFQHPTYFEPALGSVLDRIASALSTRPARRDVIALHVRAGDYRELGWQLPSAYYIRALEMLPPRAVEIVTADPVDADRLRRDCESAGYPASIGEGGTERSAFAAIASAEFVVMSNSTFCWWATAVGDHLGRGGDAICPVPWLPDVRASLCRPNWMTTDWSRETSG